jgi:hypothetical protein
MTRTCSVARDDISKCANLQFDAKDVIISTAPLRSKKEHSLPSSLGRIVGPMTKPPRDRRTQPYRQPTYRRLSARVDRLEDAISHFYNVLIELRSRVSTPGKKSKPKMNRLN